MESLFNSKFMIKLQEFGQALGRNKFLSALQAGMMSCMGVIMVGAIFQIIVSVGSTMLGLFSSDSTLYTVLYTPYNYTMNMLTVWVVAIMAYNYARSLDITQPIISTVEALVCFLLIAGNLSTDESGNTVMDTTYLGATGMFVGFLVVFVVVQIDHLCKEKNIVIKMPDVVPQFLQDGFSGIIPLLFNVAIFLIVDTIVEVGTGGAYGVCSGFLALLAAPLAAVTSVPGVIIACLFGGILWCFGIHGTMILIGILYAPMAEAIVANGELVAAGQDPVFSATMLFGAMASCGGTGNTFPVAIYGCTMAKSEQIKAVGKAAIVPGWFNINEPITFGMPVMYNPIMCIPYLLAILVNMLVYWAGYASGLLTPSWVYISALLPIGVSTYLSTFSIVNVVFDYLSILWCGAVWYPFLRAYDKQLCEQEAAAKEAQAA